MRELIASFAAVFLLTFLASPLLGSGWFWDFGNGLGFAAFAGIAYLVIASNRRLDVQAHRVLGYAVLSLVVFHAFWFLLGDATVVEYLRPGAPLYMWAGVLGLLMLFVLMIIAVPPDRQRMHDDYGGFRYWHRIISIIAVVGAGYHIAASRFYLDSGYQLVLFAVVTAAVCFGRRYWGRIGQIRIVSPTLFLVLGVAMACGFAALRNLPL